MKPLLVLILAAASLGACTDEVDVGTGEEPAVYMASIDASTLGDPPPADALTGIWILTLEGDRYRLEQDEFRVEEDLVLRDDELTVSGVPAPEGAFNCYVNDERVLERVEGAYEVKAEDDELELTAIDDPCPLRAAILERTWRRAQTR